MSDRAPGSQSLQKAPDEADEALGSGYGAVGEGDVTRCGAQGLPYEGRHRVGVRQGHVGGDGAGEFEGSALAGTQPELQGCGEGESLGDQLPGRFGASAAFRQEGVDALDDMEVGRDDGGPYVLPFGDLLDDVRREVVQRDGGVLVDAPGDQGAQREGVRAAGHVTGTMCGVLNGVVEQEGLVLPQFLDELAAGEELSERGRGECGESGAQVADAVDGAAGGALVPIGRPVTGQVDDDERGVVQGSR